MVSVPQNGSTTIALHLLRMDGATQPRAALDPATVVDYAEDMEHGAAFPPVTVFFDGTDYWLTDGFHRAAAARQIGRTEIAADVRQGSVDEARWFSYGVNQTHGLRRTNDDKRRAVEAALRHPNAANLSDNLIAQHCGVSQPFVGKVRATYNGYKSDVRTGRDGRAINTAKIGATVNGLQSTPPLTYNGYKSEPAPDLASEPLDPFEETVLAQLKPPAPPAIPPMEYDLCDYPRTLITPPALEREMRRVVQPFAPDRVRVGVSLSVHEIPEWVATAVADFEAGDADALIAMLPVSPSASWWNQLSGGVVCFLTSHFYAPRPAVIIGLGVDARRFVDSFFETGSLYRPLF